MFSNIGRKIMGLAKFVCFIGIALSLLAGFGPWLFSGGMGGELGPYALVGLFTALMGCVGSWLGALVLYGFGQMVDDTSRMREMTESKFLTRPSGESH